MRRTRLPNVAMAVVFLLMTIMAPVRALLGRGDEMLAGNLRAQLILLALFGSLTITFAWRAITAPSHDEDDDKQADSVEHSRPSRSRRNGRSR